MSNAAQIKIIYTLLGTYHLRDEKENIVKAFTGGRTTSVRDLKFNEASALIAHLRSMEVTDRRSDKMRNKILSFAHEMNWTIKGKVDMERINNWCMKFGYLHKKLDDYRYEELPTLVSQFEEVYKGYLKGV